MSDTDPMDFVEGSKEPNSGGQNPLSYNAAEQELDEKYPNRPRNFGKTFYFHELFEDLFNPLSEKQNKQTSGQVRGRRAGPHGGLSLKPAEAKRALIDRFYSRWRKEVGNDIFPALRLVLPDRDRERAMYGLKEKTLAQCLVRIMRIDKNSVDARELIDWKVPGQNRSKSAGDFAMRVFEIVSKRAFRIKVGDMTIEDVNRLLDQLAAESKLDDQVKVIEEFYKRMNAEEILWLVRIILKYMRVGATEKTLLKAWHPDAQVLYNVCSSLRRVCYELHDTQIRLTNDERRVSPMQCFQPQLATWSEKKQSSYSSMVASMRMTDDDQEFYIEDKLDGERMQLHMITEEGQRKFKFWSRSAKDYTYLYGDSHDATASLTRFIQKAFTDRVKSIIVDGEMITWDPREDKIVPFGTLKTAALKQSEHEFVAGNRPLFRVFDILYLNGRDLTRYTLRDRRKALEASITDVYRRIEILKVSVGKTAEDIERRLAITIQDGGEGLLLKNPRSMYIVNDRNDDWVKVKPEYMDEFEEKLECLIIGGFYGSGKRGGALSSFLCGLRGNSRLRPGKSSQKPIDSQSQSQSRTQETGNDAEVWLSFFKVGGGMTRDDYANIRHRTDGKWIKYDPKKPPRDIIELAGGGRQVERPDEWIKPEDSIVIEVKAGAVVPSDEYAARVTLRFPRFKQIRTDKDWTTALTLEEFQNVKATAEREHEENVKKKKMEAATAREKRSGQGQSQKSKRPLTVAGYNARSINDAQTVREKSTVFSGLSIFVMTECTFPIKKSKLELEEFIKANGGRIVQSAEIRDTAGSVVMSSSIDKIKLNVEDNKPQYLDVLCVAERRTVKVASMIKRGNQIIVRPSWIFDCVEQARKDFNKGIDDEIVLPHELKRHLFFIPEDRSEELDAIYAQNEDQYGDSFARDTSPGELKNIMDAMPDTAISTASRGGATETNKLSSILEPGTCRGNLFAGLTFYFDPIRDNAHPITTTLPFPNSTSIPRPATNAQLGLEIAHRTALFAHANITTDPSSPLTTHIVVHASSDVRSIRADLARRFRENKGVKIPRIVRTEWIRVCWEEGTRVDEERIII